MNTEENLAWSAACYHEHSGSAVHLLEPLQQFDMAMAFKPLNVFLVIRFYFLFQECPFPINRLEVKTNWSFTS